MVCIHSTISNDIVAFLTEDGVLYTWGNNSCGKLGHGDKRPRIEPERVRMFGKRKIRFVACGWSNTAAITGSVFSFHAYHMIIKHAHGWISFMLNTCLYTC